MRLLDEQRTTLARRYGISPRIVGIATRRHGQAFSARGLDVASAEPDRLKPDAPARRHARIPARRAPKRSARRRARSGAWSSSRRRRSTSSAASRRSSHVRAALAGGAHVDHGEQGAGGVRLRHAGAGRPSAPIAVPLRGRGDGRRADLQSGARDAAGGHDPRLPRRRQQHDELHPDRAGTGADASTTRWRRCRRSGIAEADASLDVDGWDAAAKTAALANVLLGARHDAAGVDREGIAPRRGGTRDEARAPRAAAEAGGAARRVRRVASRRASRLEELAGDDLLAGLEGQQNALILKTDLLGEIAIVQRGGGLTQTAYALLTDLVDDRARALRLQPATRRSRRRARRRRSL